MIVSAAMCMFVMIVHFVYCFATKIIVTVVQYYCKVSSRQFSQIPLANRRTSSILKFPLMRSEEHTSELQSRENIVCRLLLEKKKINCCSYYSISRISF